MADPCDGGVFAKPEESWERWWYEEQDHLRTTGIFGKLFEIILDLRFFFLLYTNWVLLLVKKALWYTCFLGFMWWWLSVSLMVAKALWP